MSDKSESVSELFPGWYVIEGPHQNPARVAAGPKTRREAESHASFLTDPNARIMHTPALVNAVKNDSYNVEWSEDVEKPSALSHPIHVSRSNGDVKVNVQRQLPNHGGPEYSASYQRVGEYEDGTEHEGIALSLFIKDEPTARLLYECLQEFFDGQDHWWNAPNHSTEGDSEDYTKEAEQ